MAFFVFRSFLIVILAIVFVYASIHKILEPSVFASQVAKFEILPLALISPFAYTLPILELLSGLAIFYKRTRFSALLLQFFMMLSFLIALSIALWTGKEINCGCFNAEQAVSLSKLLLDTILLCIIMGLLYFEYQNQQSTK